MNQKWTYFAIGVVVGYMVVPRVMAAAGKGN